MCNLARSVCAANVCVVLRCVFAVYHAPANGLNVKHCACPCLWHAMCACPEDVLAFPMACGRPRGRGGPIGLGGPMGSVGALASSAAPWALASPWAPASSPRDATACVLSSDIFMCSGAGLWRLQGAGDASDPQGSCGPRASVDLLIQQLHPGRRALAAPPELCAGSSSSAAATCRR